MPFVEVLQTFPELFFVSAALLGLVVGSFLNVVIARLPEIMERGWRRDCCEFLQLDIADNSAETFNLVTPRSRCPSCNHRITALENIPLLSYFFLGGKCSACKNPISMRYPAVELLTCLLTVLAAWKFGPGISTVFAWVLVWSLIVLAFIDYDTGLLPDNITLPLLWLGLIAGLFAVFTDIYSSVTGAALGYLILWSVYHAFRLVTGKEGMGYGDFKLLAALGAWFGWIYVPVIILLSSIAGSVVGISMILLARIKRETPIPFGPYLAIAGWVCLMWGAEILGLIVRVG